MHWQDMVWGQFGAAIEMLENAIRACPDDLWMGLAPGTRSDDVPFWYVALHAAYFLDVYLGDSEETYVPPASFPGAVPDPAGQRAASVYGERLCAWADLDGLALPRIPCSRDQVLAYIAHAKTRCRATLGSLKTSDAALPCGFPWLGMRRGELMLYNMRHVQHHAAQLNLLLRQTLDQAPPGWVAKAVSRAR